MRRQYFVYILANGFKGTLYVGVTNNLLGRLNEHRSGKYSGFTKQYGVYKLVYYECSGYINNVITREKQLKWWKRQWKIDLIEKDNPHWRDLFSDICS